MHVLFIFEYGSHMATLDTVSDSVTFTQKQLFFSQALSDAVSSDANTHDKTHMYYSLFLPNVKLPGIIIIIIEGFLLRTSEVFFWLFKNSLWSSERRSSFPYSSQKVFNVIAHIYSHVQHSVLIEYAVVRISSMLHYLFIDYTIL
jgi:hypothetical protein